MKGLKVFIIFYFVCACVHISMACEWRSGDSLEVWDLSFLDVGSRASDSGFRLDGKRPHLMSHFTRPVKDFRQYLFKKDCPEKC